MSSRFRHVRIARRQAELRIRNFLDNKERQVAGERARRRGGRSEAWISKGLSAASNPNGVLTHVGSEELRLESTRDARGVIIFTCSDRILLEACRQIGPKRRMGVEATAREV